MNYFHYKNNQLFCEDISVSEMASLYGTPLYIYSERTIKEHYSRLKKAFPSTIICYSLKANSNLTICRILNRLGAGFDVVSGGELYRVLKIRANPANVVFAGVGKTRDEIEYALKNNIMMFNTESIDEIQTIEQIACKLKKVALVALRINPDVKPNTHKYIITGIEETKFGFSLSDVKKVIIMLKSFRHIRFIGLHIHIGSQITETAPYLKALKKIIPLIEYSKTLGYQLEYLDIGGGLGIFYKGSEAKKASDFGSVIMPIISKLNLKLIIEPGRFIVGNAGIIVTRVVRTKSNGQNNFIICDAGMNTLIRPALYNAYHRIEPVRSKNTKNKIKANIVGPICESGDFLAKNRFLPQVTKNDLLAVFSAGAYGYSMTSNYNSRTKPAEVIVSGKHHRLITKAETYNDLIRLEKQ
jgi:diaminopimelate decarboxylase